MNGAKMMYVKRERKAKKLFSFEVPEHGGDHLDFQKLATGVSVCYRVSKRLVDQYMIEFKSVQMLNFRTEPFSVGFLPSSYDCLCEVINSDWVVDADRRMHKSEIKHFVCYFSNCGYLEVAAADFTVEKQQS